LNKPFPLRLRFSSVAGRTLFEKLILVSVAVSIFGLALSAWTFWWGTPIPSSAQEQANLLAARQEIEQVDTGATPRCWVHLETALVRYKPGIQALDRPLEVSLLRFFMQRQWPVWLATSMVGLGIAICFSLLLLKAVPLRWAAGLATIVSVGVATSAWSLSYRPAALVFGLMVVALVGWSRWWPRWLTALGLLLALLQPEWERQQQPQLAVSQRHLSLGRENTSIVPPLKWQLPPTVGSVAWHRQEWIARSIQKQKKALVLVRFHRVESPDAAWIANGPSPVDAQVVWTRAITPLVDRALCQCFPDREVFEVEAESPAPTLKPLPGLCPKLLR
jgi:hypothetical protein